MASATAQHYDNATLGTFTWPAEGAADPVTAAQLWALIAGLEVSGWKKHWRR